MVGSGFSRKRLVHAENGFDSVEGEILVTIGPYDKTEGCRRFLLESISPSGKGRSPRLAAEKYLGSDWPEQRGGFD